MPTSKMSENSIIIIADTLFYPARRNGGSIRYFTIIRELHKRGYAIDIIVINKYRENYDLSEINALKNFCSNIDLIVYDHYNNIFVRYFRRILNVLHLIAPFGIPYNLIDNNYNFYLKNIRKILKGRKKYKYGIGVGVGGCNANILLSLELAIRPAKVICDFIDSAYLLRKREHHSTNLLDKLEDIKTKQWESSLCMRCEAIYITDKDAETVGGNLAHIIPNCINTDGYSDARPVELQSPNIAFLGNMAYTPNIEACAFLIDTLFPLLKKRLPDISLYIIGRNPGDELLKHCSDSHIHVTGAVENIWDYICSVDAFVFPIQSGAGLQNKVLEAMFAGKAVITSCIGNEGIDAIHEKHLYIANNTEEYVNLIERVLRDNNRINEHASDFINANFSTSSVVDRYEKILLMTSEANCSVDK